MKWTNEATGRTIEIFNEDCMPALEKMQENEFELAIVDPEYGIGISSNPVRQMHDKKEWDNDIPSDIYFNCILSKTENQIIWGGNYFIDYLKNTQCFIVWDKMQPFEFSLAMCELA